MTAVISGDLVALKAAKARPRVESALTSDPVVGKDVLELLTSAMYVDPRAVFREYIQNAADGIDAAFAQGLIKSNQLGRVDVQLDAASRTVRIRDNGCGVPVAHARRILTSFGASEKRGSAARGFRGIGRLAALGYAQAVVFRTKAAGDTQALELRWDCRRLREALSSQEYSGDLRRIVRDCVVVVTEDDHRASTHFFEVSLEKVLRIKNDVFLNPEAVEAYLGEVVPAPFHQEFAQGADILARLQDHATPCRFRIFMNQSTTPVARPHRTTLPVSLKKTDTVSDVEFISISNGEGGVRALVWIAHHSYLGALHSGSCIRGLRARVGDIQVGDEKVFADIFPEPRFNSWTVGEVNILDGRLVPNGRRDGFEQNAAYSDFLSQLAPVARSIAKRCRQTSARRTKEKAFTARADRLRDLLRDLTQRGIKKAREARVRSDIGRVTAEMSKILRASAFDDADRRRLQRRLDSLTAQYKGIEVLTGRGDPLGGIPASRRGAYEEVLALVDDLAPNRTVARALIEKIVARLAARALRASRRRGTKS